MGLVREGDREWGKQDGERENGGSKTEVIRKDKNSNCIFF